MGWFRCRGGEVVKREENEGTLPYAMLNTCEVLEVVYDKVEVSLRRCRIADVKSGVEDVQCDGSLGL
jgi:hypothetical protein